VIHATISACSAPHALARIHPVFKATPPLSRPTSSRTPIALSHNVLAVSEPASALRPRPAPTPSLLDSIPAHHGRAGWVGGRPFSGAPGAGNPACYVLLDSLAATTCSAQSNSPGSLSLQCALHSGVALPKETGAAASPIRPPRLARVLPFVSKRVFR